MREFHELRNVKNDTFVKILDFFSENLKGCCMDFSITSFSTPNYLLRCYSIKFVHASRGPLVLPLLHISLPHTPAGHLTVLNRAINCRKHSNYHDKSRKARTFPILKRKRNITTTTTSPPRKRSRKSQLVQELCVCVCQPTWSRAAFCASF